MARPSARSPYPDPVVDEGTRRSRFPRQAIVLRHRWPVDACIAASILARHRHQHGVAVAIADVEGNRLARLERVVDAITGLGFWFDYSEFRLEGA